MRLLITLGLVLIWAVSAGASPPDCASTSARMSLVSWRPKPWHPPVRVAPVAAGIRVEPETGMPPSARALPTSTADLEAQAAARRAALEAIPIRTRPDGSRYAVIGGLVRAYTVATIGADGTLTQECVHSLEEAQKRIAAPAAQAGPTPRPATAGKKERR